MTELTDLSETDASNTTVTAANIAEGCNPSEINNAIRNTLGLIRRAFKASIFRLRDTADQTKLLAFDLSGITTGTTRTLTVQDASGTIALSADVGFKCAAWVNFNGTGVVAIRGSAGVSSVTDNGTGDYSINFTTAFADANYAAVSTMSLSSSVSAIFIPDAPTTTTFRIATYRSDTGAATDALYGMIAFFR